jgi:hypothetical protein
LGFDLSRNFKVAGLHPHDTQPNDVAPPHWAACVHRMRSDPQSTTAFGVVADRISSPRHDCSYAIDRAPRPSRVASTSSNPAAATAAPAKDTAG